MPNRQEQAILDAAQTIEESADIFTQSFDSLETEIRRLQDAAQSTTPIDNVNSVDEELERLQTAAQSLRTVAQTIRAAATGGQGSTQTPATPIEDPANPVNANPNPAVMPIPLSGESGLPNTPEDSDGNIIPVGEGEVFSGQPQPGTSPTSVGSGSEGGTSSGDAMENKAMLTDETISR